MLQCYAAVDQSTTVPLAGPKPGTRDALTEVLRDEAKRAGMSESAFQHPFPVNSRWLLGRAAPPATPPRLTDPAVWCNGSAPPIPHDRNRRSQDLLRRT